MTTTRVSRFGIASNFIVANKTVAIQQSFRIPIVLIVFMTLLGVTSSISYGQPIDDFRKSTVEFGEVEPGIRFQTRVTIKAPIGGIRIFGLTSNGGTTNFKVDSLCGFAYPQNIPHFLAEGESCVAVVSIEPLSSEFESLVSSAKEPGQSVQNDFQKSNEFRFLTDGDCYGWGFFNYSFWGYYKQWILTQGKTRL